jgi:hypothetical protein
MQVFFWYLLGTVDYPDNQANNTNRGLSQNKDQDGKDPKPKTRSNNKAQFQAMCHNQANNTTNRGLSQNKDQDGKE